MPNDAGRSGRKRAWRSVAHHHVAVTVDDVDGVEPVAGVETRVGEVQLAEGS